MCKIISVFSIYMEIFSQKETPILQIYEKKNKKYDNRRNKTKNILFSKKRDLCYLKINLYFVYLYKFFLVNKKNLENRKKNVIFVIYIFVLKLQKHYIKIIINEIK
jgi:hypothetical protein